MLEEACRLLLEEVSLPGCALGGRVEFKRTLVVSFFFKFYLEVLQELKKLMKLVSVSALAFLCSLQPYAPSFSTTFADCLMGSLCHYLSSVLSQALSVPNSSSLKGFIPAGLPHEAQDAALSSVHGCSLCALSN